MRPPLGTLYPKIIAQVKALLGDLPTMPDAPTLVAKLPITRAATVAMVNERALPLAHQAAFRRAERRQNGGNFLALTFALFRTRPTATLPHNCRIKPQRPPSLSRNLLK